MRENGKGRNALETLLDPVSSSPPSSSPLAVALVSRCFYVNGLLLKRPGNQMHTYINAPSSAEDAEEFYGGPEQSCTRMVLAYEIA